ncbi:MAG: alpha-glucuronidase family glycosyl hydrolase [Candidatus Acidiferrales bacterium]
MAIDGGSRLRAEVFATRVRLWRRSTFFALILAVLLPAAVRADSGYAAWLRYAQLTPAEQAKYNALPAAAVVLGNAELLRTSQTELIRGVRGMLGRTLRAEQGMPTENSILLTTLDRLRTVAPRFQSPRSLAAGGYWIATARVGGYSCLIIAGADSQGTLHGTFDLLRKIALNEDVNHLRVTEQPSAPVRWVNQWDNLNGSIERGYGGRSIFFENGSVRTDLTRASDYARLLASVGINGCVVNNVNADPRILSADFIPQLARIADAFRPWGVKLAVSVDFSAPKALGQLDTFDPLDPRVIAWWNQKVGEIYRQIPDLGGFLVKADSEGEPGPASYGRTPADAANMLAGALKPHGGVLLYRAFVYNSHLNWRNLKNDRAKAAYDIFHPLDGKFAANVIVQIKNGPIDFQVREPASSLFGGLQKTNEAIELEITQEYTGQQRHLVFLVPMWKTTLDFDMHVNGRFTPVKGIVTGHSFHRPLGGFAGVSNVGLDANWLGNPMAMANLYGFGRLAWNPNLTAEAIIDEWTRLTFGNNPVVVRTIDAMQLSSWRTYEDYTGPLGAGTLTDILGSHYGPGVGSAEHNGWGQWFRADHHGVGMDRTVATGTGYVGQYSPQVQKEYETLHATPDNLLLFFHHVPYTYKLHSGQTVIQYIYDSHYEGVERVKQYVREWESLRGLVDEQRYAFVLARLKYQVGASIVWRDAVCNWFYRMSGIPDARGRVGHYPDRTEAESMELQGYTVVDVTPRENASGGKAVECSTTGKTCIASFHFKRPAGWYQMDVQYFDLNNGQSTFKVLVGKQLVDQWIADDDLPSSRIGGDTSTRREIPGLALRPGDLIRIEGTPNGGEPAPFDYVSIHRTGP